MSEMSCPVVPTAALRRIPPETGLHPLNSTAAGTAAGPGPRTAPPPRSAWWSSAPLTNTSSASSTTATTVWNLAGEVLRRLDVGGGHDFPHAQPGCTAQRLILSGSAF